MHSNILTKYDNRSLAISHLHLVSTTYLPLAFATMHNCVEGCPHQFLRAEGLKRHQKSCNLFNTEEERLNAQRESRRQASGSSHMYGVAGSWRNKAASQTRQWTSTSTGVGTSFSPGLRPLGLNQQLHQPGSLLPSDSGGPARSLAHSVTAPFGADGLDAAMDGIETMAGSSSAGGVGQVAPNLATTPVIPPIRIRLPRPIQEILPEPIPTLRRVTLIVRETMRPLRTALNSLGLSRLYLSRPTFEPDAFVAPEDLAKSSNNTQCYDDLMQVDVEAKDVGVEYLHENKTAALLVDFKATGSQQKSDEEINRLVNEYLHHPDFKLKDLGEPGTFRIQKIHRQMDKADENHKSPLLDHRFKETSVPIEVPSGSPHEPSRTFSIPGLYYRPLTSLIRSAFSHPLAAQFHLTPFQLFHTSPVTGKEQRVWSEVYDSDVFKDEHSRIQFAPRPPGETRPCSLEKVVAALMFWSDSTHLANFGMAKLWPIYMFMGNLSKYVRALPMSGACQHVAYIPSLPDSFQDDMSRWHTQWLKPHHRKDVLTHCRRELMHGVWKLLLDEDFLHAYKYGMVIKCVDGIERRVFPRFFTYAADYPEKVLLATIRDKGLCLCPRCFIPKNRLHLMGLVDDMRDRLDRARTYMWEKVEEAQDWIYRKGKGIKSKAVEDLLKDTSSVPTENAFIEKLGHDFKLSRMMAPDFMHEFELGVWKQLFTHLIRVLYAAKPNGRAVMELDYRFRKVPTFGTSTIRKFATNTSEMKKLAARDFEDILQCSIPVFDGLLPADDGSEDGPSEDEKKLLKLLYRTAELHAFAKMRVHTEETLTHLEKIVKEFGAGVARLELRHQELNSRPLKQHDIEGPRSSTSSHINSMLLDLGDLLAYIRMFGGTDGYSTQPGELAHRLVKHLYGSTNKRAAGKQIGKRMERLERARLARHYRLKQAQVQNVVHRDKRPPLRGGMRCDNELEVETDRDHRFYISASRNNSIDIYELIKNNRDDPVYKDFIPKLKNHLLGRRLNCEFDGDNHEKFTHEDRNMIHIQGEKIFQVETCQINFTTYDNRRDYDTINPKTRPDVILLAGEDDRNVEPFWYARVLGIYHAKVSTTHPDAQVKGSERMSFFLVRWFGSEPNYSYGFRSARLPKIGFVPWLEEKDNFAFGFLDPARVLRGCHIIPNFRLGTTTTLLPYESQMARQLPDEQFFEDELAVQPVFKHEDYVNYLVDIFVDRDMVMRHFGGAIGHLDQVAQNDINVSDIVPTDEIQAQAEASAAAAAIQAAEAAVQTARTTAQAATPSPSLSGNRDEDNNEDWEESDAESDTEADKDGEGPDLPEEKELESEDEQFDAESDYDSE